MTLGGVISGRVSKSLKGMDELQVAITPSGSIEFQYVCADCVAMSGTLRMKEI